jgi:pimeloyl-ACP methyl ester carboxylesterase
MTLAHALWLAAGAAALGLAVLGFALWRDPYRLVRAEYARQRLALGFARRTATIHGHRWVYAEHAAAPRGAATLVMLHGYTGSKENWYRLAARLRGRYRLLAPDLPGWGESERKPDADYGYAAEAGHVAAFLRDVAGGPVVLLGHSMGGGIAALVAAREPRLVSHLVLLDAAGVAFAENDFASTVLAGDNPFGVVDAASLEHYLSILFHEARTRPPIPWPAAHALVAHRRHQAGFEQSVLDRIGRGDEQFLPGEEAMRIRQPTLLVWGAQDRVVDASAMELYAARIPQARRLLLPDCGHMSLMECPEAVADAVRSLLGDCQRPITTDREEKPQ